MSNMFDTSGFYAHVTG